MKGIGIKFERVEELNVKSNLEYKSEGVEEKVEEHRVREGGAVTGCCGTVEGRSRGLHVPGK